MNAPDASTRSAEPIDVVLLTDIALMSDGLVRALASHPTVRIVATAATVAAAIDALTIYQSAIVLLDMSTAARFEIMQSVRAALPTVRIVGFAINDGDDELLDAVQAGVAGFVPKNGSLDDLAAAIMRAARGEALCSPRVTARLFDRLAALAASQTQAAAGAALSAREHEIAALIDCGLSNKAIARRLDIGLATVKNHVHSILEKLNVSRRGEAVAVLRAVPAPVGRSTRTMRPGSSGRA